MTHVANLPWLLANGLHSANGGVVDPNFTSIGNPDLIAGRAHRRVPVPPGGTLADYVPFYFTPRSPMLLNIKTGYNGVTRRANADILILVSSCQVMAGNRVTMLFTDRHAYTATAKWTNNQADLAHMIDWDILSRHDFARSDAYPDKMERYQAEALAHRHVPSGALRGIGCPSDTVKTAIEAHIQAAGLALPVFVRPGWYF
ncbi:MAG TPA: DUF4433 domain-containing protein [Stellaceae bacterium]|nr:DUF4433 domain-containing protein [Stellaceae bacterium]